MDYKKLTEDESDEKMGNIEYSKWLVKVLREAIDQNDKVRYRNS